MPPDGAGNGREEANARNTVSEFYSREEDDAVFPTLKVYRIFLFDASECALTGYTGAYLSQSFGSLAQVSNTSSHPDAL